MDWYSRASNRLGNVLSAERRYAEARAAYETAISAGVAFEGTALGQERRSFAVARGNRGILANREGQSKEAIQFLREVEPFITQTMDGATLLMELAIAEYHSGHRRRAYALGIAAKKTRARGLHVGVTLAESDPDWEGNVLPGACP